VSSTGEPVECDTLSRFLDQELPGGSSGPMGRLLMALGGAAIRNDEALGEIPGAEELELSFRTTLTEALEAAEAEWIWLAGEPSPWPRVEGRHGEPDGAGILLLPLEAGAGAPAHGGPVGTLFTVRGPGEVQVGGMLFHGTHTAMLLALEGSTHLLRLDRRASGFVVASRNLRIPEAERRFALVPAETGGWEPEPLGFAGKHLLDGSAPFRTGSTVRPIHSLSWETYRILREGGALLRPATYRGRGEPGENLYLRHHEALPVALLIEGAGGMATDGRRRLTQTRAPGPWARTPLVMGSTRWVEAFIHSRPSHGPNREPLFASRGLFRP
jgi:hypothetical protein